MAKNQGTLVIAPIRPNDDQDKYPTAHANELKGGYHVVSQVSDLSTITTARKQEGMLAAVVGSATPSENTIYQLESDLTTWTPLQFSGNPLHIGDALPADPEETPFWYHSDQGVLKIYYTDNGNAVWVDASPGGFGPGGGSLTVRPFGTLSLSNSDTIPDAKTLTFKEGEGISLGLEQNPSDSNEATLTIAASTVLPFTEALLVGPGGGVTPNTTYPSGGNADQGPDVGEILITEGSGVSLDLDRTTIVASGLDRMELTISSSGGGATLACQSDPTSPSIGQLHMNACSDYNSAADVDFAGYQLRLWGEDPLDNTNKWIPVATRPLIVENEDIEYNGYFPINFEETAYSIFTESNLNFARQYISPTDSYTYYPVSYQNEQTSLIDYSATYFGDSYLGNPSWIFGETVNGDGISCPKVVRVISSGTVAGSNLQIVVPSLFTMSTPNQRLVEGHELFLVNHTFSVPRTIDIVVNVYASNSTSAEERRYELITGETMHLVYGSEGWFIIGKHTLPSDIPL